MATSDPDRLCRDCRNWRETPNLADDLAMLGQCRKRPPMILQGAEPGKLLTRFPLMREDGDCGGFETMTQKQKEMTA